MRISPYLLSVALVCFVVLVHMNSAAGQSTSEPSAQTAKPLLPCAQANVKSGYRRDLKFMSSKRQIKVYDTDVDETHKHDPICLSKQNDDAIFWVSGSGKNFRLKIYPQDDSGNCGRHPFKFDPSQDSLDGYYSGPLRDDVRVGCVYNVEFHREGEKTADPHIQITK